jgi:hypothetical protein
VIYPTIAAVKGIIRCSVGAALNRAIAARSNRRSARAARSGGKFDGTAILPPVSPAPERLLSLEGPLSSAAKAAHRGCLCRAARAMARPEAAAGQTLTDLKGRTRGHSIKASPGWSMLAACTLFWKSKVQPRDFMKRIFGSRWGHEWALNQKFYLKNT